MNYNENKIKEQLDKRAINPSNYLWDKLENQLDKEAIESKQKYWWIGIAASFILGGLLSLHYLHQPTVLPAVTIANQTQTTPNRKVKSIASESVTIDESNIQNITDQKNNVAQFQNSNTRQLKIAQLPSKIETIENPTTEKINISSVEPVISSNNKPIQKKVNQKQKTILATKDMSVKEVDVLLKNAQSQLQYEAILDKSKNNVNPDILLHEVQLDKTASLSDYLKQTVKDGLRKTKIVAEK